MLVIHKKNLVTWSRVSMFQFAFLILPKSFVHKCYDEKTRQIQYQGMTILIVKI
jgi:hypothetical protein